MGAPGGPVIRTRRDSRLRGGAILAGPLLVHAREDYELEASSSSTSTWSTSAARTVSSIDASFTKPACNRSELAFRHRVEVHTRSDLGRTHPLQPTKENLSGTRIGNSALTQTTLDLCVRRGLTLSACCAALATQRCGFARFLFRPPVRSSSVLVSFRLSDSVSFVQLGREHRLLVTRRGHR